MKCDSVYQGWSYQGDLRIVVYLDDANLDQIYAALEMHDAANAVTIETRLSHLLHEAAIFNGSTTEIRAALQSALAALDRLDAAWPESQKGNKHTGQFKDEGN